MISVGILANNPIWEEYLGAFSQGAPFEITGRIEDQSLDTSRFTSCIQESDVIWIPQLTPHSIETAIYSLRQSRHVLLGFPVVDFQSEVNRMVHLSREANVDIQVGHHDRYHPAFRSVLEQISSPQFVYLQHEQKTLLDADQEKFLLQSILYDVDAILALIPHPVKNVQAHISRVHPSYGRAIHIRLNFHNGSGATIQFKNLGFENKRLIEITDYQKVFRINLLQGEAFLWDYQNSSPSQEQLWPVGGELGMSGEAIDEETLTRECVSFFQRKALNRKPLASIEDGWEALQITEIIRKKIGIGLN